MIRTVPARPPEVQEAHQLILGAWIISSGAFVVSFYRAASALETDPIGMTILAGGFTLMLGLTRLWLLSRLYARKRWSPIAMLILLLVGWTFLASALWAPKVSDLDPLRAVADACAVVMEAFACKLLFCDESSRWFRVASHPLEDQGAA